jgi:hypothetical protein
MLALLADWLNDFLADDHDGLTITHDDDADTLGGGAGTDTASPLLPQDNGDWDNLLP